MAPSVMLIEPLIAQYNMVEDNSALKKQTPVNPSHEEHQYLNLIRNILDNGEHRPDRYALITARSEFCMLTVVTVSEQARARSLSSPLNRFDSPSPVPPQIPQTHQYLSSPS